MNTCRSCGAKILWVKTKNGKNMPIDEESVEPRDCEDTDILVSEEGAVAAAKFAQDADEIWHVSHFSTCPKAAEHRRKK